MIGELEDRDKILITEGYATGATLHELTGLPVVVAFHAGNLPTVAEAFREKYPEALLLIAGDDDHNKPSEKNVGRQKAEEAAQKVNGYTLLPAFGKNDSGTDWNDAVKQHGKEVVQHRLKIGITVAEKKHQEQKQQWAREIEMQKQEKTAQMSKEPDKALVQSGGRSLSL